MGLTKNTAVFYGPKGIRCNAIMAGGMMTNIFKPFMETGINMEGMAIMRKTFPESDFAYVELEKVAKLVTYLCSDSASIVNGACWTADGGTTAN
jgi:NAD(P)-dependent dehydrogenase (short-subunit alcohol dehydrogenase family)